VLRGSRSPRSASLSSVLLFALVFLFFARGGLFVVFVWLLQGAQHVLFQGLLFEHEAVFIPDKVWGLNVELIALHAHLEQVQNVSVVRVGSEAQRSAVLHVLLELVGLIQAQLVNCNLLLLSLDIVIFFILAAARETLPRKGSSQEVEQDVTNGL